MGGGKKHGLQRLQRNKTSYQQTNLFNRSSLINGGPKSLLYIGRRRLVRIKGGRQERRGGEDVYMCVTDGGSHIGF